MAEHQGSEDYLPNPKHDGRMFKHNQLSDDPSLSEVLTEDIEYSYETVDENTFEREPDTTFLTFWVCLFTECTALVDYEFLGDNAVYLIQGNGSGILFSAGWSNI